MMFRYAAEVSA